MQGLCDSNSQSTKRDASAGNPLPTCARERGHGVDVFSNNAPVHNRLCFSARHRIGDIGATHRERSANKHSENQAHETFPQASPALVAQERGAIVKNRGVTLRRWAAINLAQAISLTAI